jgi:hypothetical protein
MENGRIDILDATKQVIFENYKNSLRTIYDLNNLSEEEQISYDLFMSLVEQKTTAPYTNIYITNSPNKFLTNASVITEGLVEIYYNTFDALEKDVFDTFFSTFSK